MMNNWLWRLFKRSKRGKSVSRLEHENDTLRGLLLGNGSFRDALAEADGTANWNHWAIKLLIGSFEESLCGAANGVAMNVGYPGTDRYYDVQIVRVGPGKPTMADRLAVRDELLEGLLVILGIHCTDLNDDNHLFKLLFNVDERIVIKRAKQIVEEAKRCTEAAAESIGGASEQQSRLH